ncbi:MAG: TlpA disulfide reductase family protein, partial [Vulcanimicrobiota bacterium]
PSETPTPTQGQTSASGDPSPKFSLTSPDGTTVKFDPSQNPDNEVFLLYFWSYRWDPNVVTFRERTSELHERFAPRGLVVYGIAYDEEPAGLRKYLSQNSLPFEVVVGTDATYRDFKIESIPTGILVDSSGKIAERFSGYYSTEELAEKISPYLPGRTGNSGG